MSTNLDTALETCFILFVLVVSKLKPLEKIRETDKKPRSIVISTMQFFQDP